MPDLHFEVDHSIAPCRQAESVDRVKQILQALMAGERLVVVLDKSKSARVQFLDQLATALLGCNFRVIRATSLAGRPIDLPGLMDQVVGHDRGDPTERAEQFYHALSRADTGETKLSLIIDDAHLMTEQTLRYLDLLASFASMSPVPLQLVLAGRPQLWARLPNAGGLAASKVTTRIAFADEPVLPRPAPSRVPPAPPALTTNQLATHPLSTPLAPPPLATPPSATPLSATPLSATPLSTTSRRAATGLAMQPMPGSGLPRSSLAAHPVGPRPAAASQAGGPLAAAITPGAGLSRFRAVPSADTHRATAPMPPPGYRKTPLTAQRSAPVASLQDFPVDDDPSPRSGSSRLAWAMSASVLLIAAGLAAVRLQGLPSMPDLPSSLTHLIATYNIASWTFRSDVDKPPSPENSPTERPAVPTIAALPTVAALPIVAALTTATPPAISPAAVSPPAATPPDATPPAISPPAITTAQPSAAASPPPTAAPIPPAAAASLGARQTIQPSDDPPAQPAGVPPQDSSVETMVASNAAAIPVATRAIVALPNTKSPEARPTPLMPTEQPDQIARPAPAAASPTAASPSKVAAASAAVAPAAAASIALSVPPPEPAAAAVMSAARPLPPAVLDALLARGDNLLANGDIAAARLMYERAAAANSAPAAVALGMTYDPRLLSEIGARGISADPQRAILWYGRAANLGNIAAARLLRELRPTASN